MRTFKQLKKYLRKDRTDYFPANDVVMTYEGKTIHRIEQVSNGFEMFYEDIYGAYDSVAIDPEGDYNLNQIEVYERVEWSK